MNLTPIHMLRVIAFIEGMSLLILLFIAMPLKYFANIPEAVSIVGAVHGGLFILYILGLLYATIRVRWSMKWPTAGIVAAFIPFGNFLYDKGLKRFK